MKKYVALLRGIMPTNPNMKSEKLKAVFESLGYKNVTTVIASGNVVFEDGASNASKLETEIEKELEKKLGFKTTAIIRTDDELKKLVKKDPFKGVKDEKPNYLLVTFFKDRKKELCTVINLDKGKTPDFMRDAEKKYGKEITSRTWKTIGRILTAMEKIQS